MLSGRFDEPEIIKYIKDVKRGLDEKGVAIYMVDAKEGEDFAEATIEGLGGAWAMIVFGTSEYGAKTGAGYETYEELRYAWDKKLPLFPIQLCERWPPEPKDKDGGSKGKNQNSFMLRDTVIRLSDPEMKKPQEIAEKLAERLLGTKDREFVLQPSFFKLHTVRFLLFQSDTQQVFLFPISLQFDRATANAWFSWMSPCQERSGHGGLKADEKSQAHG
eukprot:Skav235413  [mRNA]  locus=scaffold924:43650:44303:+ [translate_table: standard]